ncbi:MAG: GyaR protein [Oscillospiraceae bacterium]|nr:GyaR protein [Oscillospiraceae bacterium]
MKIALLTNRESIERFSDPAHIRGDWELVFLGNGAPDPDAVAATEADVIVADSMLPVGAEIISRMPKLRLIHAQGVGYDRIDLAAAAKAGVYVCNCAGSNARAVAEQAMLLIMALLRGFRAGEEAMFACRQTEARTAGFASPARELGDCSVGIVGFGAVGRALGELLAAAGSRIFWYDPSRREYPGAEYLPLDELYSSCDVVSLNLPVLPETVGMINDAALARFKPGALLINTSRGELVDNGAVVRALRSGRLGGFGADTIAPEPVRPDDPFLTAPDIRGKIALSPHVGGLTVGGFRRAYATIWSNVAAVERGERPVNIVNGL